MTMIKVEGLTRYYGRFPAVRDVSFTIDDRVIVGFLGLNGAGKSTVLKCLAGLLMPSAGSISIGGIDALENPEALRSKIGFLPEDPPLYRDMQVAEFLRWCGQMKGMSSSAVDKRLPEVLRICDLTHMADRVIDTLSHGYRKRVGIAQAIIHGPDLVILDEPISGLDPVQIVGMRKVLRQLAEDCTVLVSSHILSEIAETCDRLLMLKDGRLVAQGDRSEFSEKMTLAPSIEFSVRGSFDDARAALEAVDGVQSVTGKNLSGEVIDITVALETDNREALVAALVSAGLGIRRMEASEGNLERTFLELTNNDIPEAS
jgi:ABC-2 type transport system ATP-binding protein